MSRDIKIEEIQNGFLVTESTLTGPERRAFSALDEVFAFLLGHFERRHSHWNGDGFGRVLIERGKDE